MMDDSGYPSSSHGSSQSQRHRPSNIFPGKLKKVLLKNFMCHEHFEIEFNSCINFIHGRNGSGKSAIATALVLGFGSRATATQRGVAVKSFIKRGRRMATIEITLHNNGVGNKYKHSQFGKEVTVIRKIIENGGSQYRIRGEKGSEEALSRHELDSLLLHFNIQPQNPLCILSQDTARSFFKSRDPKQMYQLFMQGTQMESINDSNRKNMEHMVKLVKECEKSKQDLKKMYEDVREADKKQEIVIKLIDAKEQKTNLEKELSWTKVVVWEKKINTIKKDLTRAVVEKEEFENNEENQGGSKDSLMEEKTELEAKLNQIETDYYNVENELKTNMEIIQRSRDQLKNKKQYLEKEKMMIASLDDNINQLNTGIEKIQSKHSQSQEYQHKLKVLIEKINETEAAIKTTEIHLRQLNDTLEEYTKKFEEKKNDIQNNSYKCKDFELKLNQLRQGNSLGVYGHWMPKLVESIKDACNRGMFRENPRGPLGAYIQVNDKAWLPAVESLLGNMLPMFCVSCAEDSLVLNNIFNRVIDRSRSKPPGIVISKFLPRVHDYKKYEVRAGKYYSLISSVKITDPVVTNCLIDQAGIEQILLVADINEALRLMDSEQNVPANCKFTITRQCDHIYPAPNYRFYDGGSKKYYGILQADVSQQEKEVEIMLRNLRQDNFMLENKKKEIVREINAVQVQIQAQNEEVRKLVLKKKKFHIEKLELEKNFQFEPQSIEMYKNEIVELTNKKQTILNEIEVLKKDKDNLNTKIQQNNKQRNELLAKQTELAAEISSIKSAVGVIEKKLREWHRREDEYKRQLAEKNTRLSELKKTLEECDKRLVAAKTATENIEPVKVTRSTDAVKKDINSIEAAIRVFAQELGNSQQQVDENIRCKKRQYENKKESIRQLEKCIERSGKVLRKDQTSFEMMKKRQIGIAQLTFRSLLKIRKLAGDLNFDCKDKKLVINAMPNIKGSSKEGSTALSSLSGGERSYVTTAFIRSIWCCMSTPFYVLDEFDVFTDLSNRTQIIHLLIDHAKDNPQCQYLFITPLDLSHIVTDDIISIHVIRNPRDE